MLYFATLLTIIAVSFSGVSLADFSMYLVPDAIVDGTTVEGYKFIDGEPTCERLKSATTFYGYDDVSGDNWGVRVEWGTERDTWQEVEYNLHELGHYTWYADRNSKLYDLSNIVVGSCNRIRTSEEHRACDTIVATEQMACKTFITPKFDKNSLGT
ncbi:hypothetical protein SUNI508_10678 [Seiridium unicorne]|uniref:Uncharacterized protein n=1 Tax=Seiridium unicorne TaxID=138068 RepID=A0ABR2UKD1_9PEZI